MTFISNYLFHPFPSVRRFVAEELYLIILNEEKEEKAELEALLLETEWSEPLIVGLKSKVNSLIDIIF